MKALLFNQCLQTMEIMQDHTAESLKEVLTDMLSSWKISSKVCGAVTDNASKSTLSGY